LDEGVAERNTNKKKESSAEVVSRPTGVKREI
jgi:hypothetical protein